MIKILYTSSQVDYTNTSLLNGKDTDVPKLKDVLMRQITWIVLFSYTLLMFRPVTPIVMDVLAHTFWEKQHMLVVHEVNGKFHVHNELINVSHQSEKDKQSGSCKFQLEQCIPAKKQVIANIVSLYTFNKHSYPSFSCFFPSSSFELESPPPKI